MPETPRLDPEPQPRRRQHRRSGGRLNLTVAFRIRGRMLVGSVKSPLLDRLSLQPQKALRLPRPWNVPGISNRLHRRLAIPLRRQESNPDDTMRDAIPPIMWNPLFHATVAGNRVSSMNCINVVCDAGKGSTISACVVTGRGKDVCIGSGSGPKPCLTLNKRSSRRLRPWNRPIS